MRGNTLFRSPVVFLAVVSVLTGAEAYAAPLRISKVLSNDTTASFLPAGPGARNLETSSAVVPPGADVANCSAGRLFVSNAGRWLTRIDLAGTGVAPATQSVFQLDSLIPRGQKIASLLVGGVCQIDPVNPQFEFNGGGDDTHVLRVGPKPGSLIVAFTGSHSVSVPAGKPPLATDIVVGGNTLAKAGACSWTRNNVNFLARTDDCGNNWKQAIVSIDNGPADAIQGPFTNGCGNMDQTMLYRDPFSPGHELYALGGTGPSCAGGVDGSVLYWSGDEGASWKRIFVFQGLDLYTPSLTATPSGILVAFGCTSSSKAVLAYSYSRGLSFQTEELGVPCGTVSAQEMSLCSNTPTATSLSFAKTSEDGIYDIVRLLYPVVVKPATPQENPKQAFRMEFANLRRKPVLGLPVSFFGAESLSAVTAGSNILRASFIDPDGFGVPGTPRSTLLWWEEGRGQQFRTFYQVLTGISTRSETYPLSVKGGASELFSTLFVFPSGSSCRFAGDYDRGSFYQGAGATPRYLAQWSESHQSSNFVMGDAIVHFNTVQVQMPSFTGWSQVGGSQTLSGVPAAVSTGPEKIELFYRADDGALESRRASFGIWEATPRPWGGTLTSSPAVAARGDGRLDVFGIGKNDHMWHLVIRGDDVETGWHDLGEVEFQGQPGAVSTGVGKVTVFGMRKSDGQVLALSWNQGWSQWIPVSQGRGFGGVGAVSWGPGRIDLFVRGMNGRVWHYGSDQGTAEFPGEWEDLGGNAIPLVAPAATSDGPGRLHVFIAQGDVDRSIAYRRYDGGWGDWISVGGSTPGGPAAVVSTGLGKRLRVYVRGQNDRLWEKTSSDGL